MDPAEATRFLLLFIILPLWLAAGVADWACHRATDIADTSGVKESLLHLLMLAEMGVAVLAGLFLEITTAVMALMVAAFVLHEVTALWDVSYSSRYRRVTPIEQHVHSFLEMLPLMALCFVAVLHWPQVAAGDWSLRPKAQPLPVLYLTVMLSLVVFTNVLPFLEELLRGIDARRVSPAAPSPPAAAAGNGRTGHRSPRG